ncbi:hypothetical protein [Bacillus paranthracis]|uniref:hypothetical protein n=1 Tax=Bacillus paranthracis TaxID=2026186 RepID=UPI002DB774DE|nr:hypothetical protein [Bacillus paranthracis]MEC1628674.1 hypothetical protein [Bacillus paranthracis]
MHEIEGFKDLGKGAYVYMDFRNIDNRNISVGSIAGSNTVVLNTGDGAKQQVKVTQESLSKDAFQDLIKEIEKIADPDEKQDATDNIEKLQEAVLNGNKSRAQRIFKWLPEIISTSKAALEVYSQIEQLSS